MFRFLTPRRLVVLALALTAALAGCSKKITSVDADYTQLEGTPNPDARLFVWRDLPTEIRYFADLGTPGPSEVDTLLEVVPAYRSGVGVVQTMLLDGSTASGFEFFRRAANGGFQPMRDYVVTAPRKWLDSHWELYELADTSPSSYTPATYMARGLIAGATTQASPLTNAAELASPATNNLVYTGDLFGGNDSLFTMSWNSVPGASGYWIHVYQFRSDATNDEIIASGTPSPIWNGKVRDQFVGYVAAPATSYRLGSPGARVLTFTPPLFGQEYLVRITAVGPTGQVMAYIGTDLSNIRYDVNTNTIQGAAGGGFKVVQESGRWKIFPLGAAVVTPTKPTRLVQEPAPGGFGLAASRAGSGYGNGR